MNNGCDKSYKLFPNMYPSLEFVRDCENANYWKTKGQINVLNSVWHYYARRKIKGEIFLLTMQRETSLFPYHRNKNKNIKER